VTRTRLARRTTTLANGTSVTTTRVVQAPVLEWVLQAAAVRAARSLPEFGDTWAARADGTFPGFTLAGDFNAGRRSPQESVKAKATGLVKGEADLRLYFEQAKFKMIEYKGEKGRLSPEQITRHALFRGLGFEVVVIKAATEADASAQTLAHIQRWLAPQINSEAGRAAVTDLRATVAANDNNKAQVAALGRMG